MSKLTNLQVGRYASDAGFSGTDLVTAVAVANAESSRRTDAVGDGGDSIGLWQINIPSHPQYTVAQLKDPAQNAAAAKSIRDGGRGWNNWTQYRNGTYRSYLDQVQRDILAESDRQIQSGGGFSWSNVPIIGGILGGVEDAADAVTDTATSLASIAGAVVDAGKWLTKTDNLIRVGLVLGGAVIVVGASLQLARGTDIGQTVEGVATTVATKGAAGVKSAKAAS